jgi:hypothetical protein
MKQLVHTILALASAAAAFAQGTVLLDNNVPGKVVAPVYGPNPTHSWDYFSGNSPTGFPPGTNDYTGFPLLRGPEWVGQLYGAAGSDLTAPLIPQGSPTTFRTSGYLRDATGFLNPITVTLTDIPADAPAAVFQLRVWMPEQGSTWEQASSVYWWMVGASPVFLVDQIGGAINPPPALNGLVSFNAYTRNSLPEPSSFALSLIGAAGLLLRHVRKE